MEINEKNWLESDKAGSMHQVWCATISDRKARLLAVAYCRLIGPVTSSAYVNAAIGMAEKYVDGNADQDELEAAAREIARVLDESYAREYLNAQSGLPYDHAWYRPLKTAQSAVALSRPDILDASLWGLDACREQGFDYVESSVAQSELLRDIFGNPFRHITPDPRWFTSTVVDLAKAIYEERAFDRMPILADALMDAGCDSEEIIEHCRGSGPHVRGCWVVDLLLGKE